MMVLSKTLHRIDALLVVAHVGFSHPSPYVSIPVAPS